MFRKKKRRKGNNSDWEDFMAQSKGRDFALFKHLGGLAGVERVLSGFPALTVTVPECEVAETWMTVTVKTGHSVIAGFYTAFLADCKSKGYEQTSLSLWRDEISSNSDLDEMKVELCRVEARMLTGLDKYLPRSVFFKTVRHPYQILPVEILAQLPTAFEELSDQDWDTFLRMYAQPTVHDAAGGFNKLLELDGTPRDAFTHRTWRMRVQEWRTNIDETVVADPKISPHDRILVMKVPYELEW